MSVNKSIRQRTTVHVHSITLIPLKIFSQKLVTNKKKYAENKNGTPPTVLQDFPPLKFIV